MATEYGQGYGMHGTVADERTRRRLPTALRAPVEARSWRELGYVLLSLPISIRSSPTPSRWCRSARAC